VKCHAERSIVILSQAKDLPVGSGFLAALGMTVVGRFLSDLTSETRGPVLRMTFPIIGLVPLAAVDFALLTLEPRAQA